MNATITGTLFDGDTLTPRPIALETDGRRVRSLTAGLELDVPLDGLRASDRLASLPRFLYLPDGRTVETADNDTIDALLAGQKRARHIALIHWLEVHSRAAATATVLLVTILAGVLWWGLPVLARQAAFAAPAAIEQQAGRTALATLNRMLAQTRLQPAERARAVTQLNRLLAARPLPVQPQLVFRSMDGSYPNAFALPGGLIVISDELITLASNDELAAVLAHEIGHWQLRHGLQGVLRNSAALLVVCTVTGDLTGLTTFAGTLPFTLLQRGYSREFEEEADAYALDLLRQARIDVVHLATILKKLEEARPKQGQDFTYLSTHPATADRITQIHARRAALPALTPEPTAPRMFAVKTKPAPLPGWEPRELDLMPSPLQQAAPVYPPAMAEAGVKGSVVVEFTIDERGIVDDLRTLRSTHLEFEAPALQAVRGWEFIPGKKDGRNVRTRATQLIEFNLDDPPPGN